VKSPQGSLAREVPRKPKFCRDCKHYDPLDGIAEGLCLRERFHMVTGEPLVPTTQRAMACRTAMLDCGPWAFFWEAKEPPK
jgi:hypothetical protein